MSLLGAAAISGGSSLIGSLINKIGQKKTEQRQIKHNKELADYQYSKDLEMWETQNAYNKPGEQMKRLKEAGLNPNLVYGTGTVTGNTSGQLPKYNAPTTQFKNVPMADPGQMLGMYNNLQQSQAQLGLTKALTQLNERKATTETFGQMLKGMQAKKMGLDIGFLPELQKHNLQIKQGILNQQEAQLGLTKSSMDSIKFKNEMQKMLNKRGKQGIFQGDNNLKTLFQMMQSQWKKIPLDKWSSNPYK